MGICISRLQIPRLCIILDWNNDEYSDSQALAKKRELTAMNLQRQTSYSEGLSGIA